MSNPRGLSGHISRELGAQAQLNRAMQGGGVAVLVLPSREILVSGKVARGKEDDMVVQLDVLTDEYRSALADYVTRLQMMDYIV